jgi:hypothetical protein
MEPERRTRTWRNPVIVGLWVLLVLFCIAAVVTLGTLRRTYDQCERIERAISAHNAVLEADRQESPLFRDRLDHARVVLHRLECE